MYKKQKKYLKNFWPKKVYYPAKKLPKLAKIGFRAIKKSFPEHQSIFFHSVKTGHLPTRKGTDSKQETPLTAAYLFKKNPKSHIFMVR